MRVNGWFDGINVWKIHTLGDLIFYVLLILLGVLIFFLVIRRINHNRRPDVAMKRVARRLKRLYALYAAAEDELLLQSIREQRAALERSVHSARRACLRLHLLDEYSVPEDVLSSVGAPFVDVLCHDG